MGREEFPWTDYLVGHRSWPFQHRFLSLQMADGSAADRDQPAEQVNRVVAPVSAKTAGGGWVLTPVAVRKVWDLLEQEDPGRLR
ncbi:hypothetical protein GCM10010429_34360 [Micromonospora olivasterospora]